MIWLKCSLSNCLCGCCVDKTQTNYSVGRWLSARQQSVGVMDRRCSQMGFLGRGNQRCCPLNPGLYLLLVKAPKKIGVLASWQHTEVNRASTLGTVWTSLHSACLRNVFITYQNFVFLITRLIEVRMECQGERQSLETNRQAPHFYQSIGLIDNQYVSIWFKTNYCDLAESKRSLLLKLNLRY